MEPHSLQRWLLPRGHMHSGSPSKDLSEPETPDCNLSLDGGGLQGAQHPMGGTFTLNPKSQGQGSGQASERPPTPCSPHRVTGLTGGLQGRHGAVLHEPRFAPMCSVALPDSPQNSPSSSSLWEKGSDFYIFLLLLTLFRKSHLSCQKVPTSCSPSGPYNLHGLC